MDNRLIHTPDGVRDIYGNEYIKRGVVADSIEKTIAGFGYMNIQTPSFEFFDVFSKEIGTNPSNELYKFFDRDNNTLVLRPDFTPSIARASAKYFVDEKQPIRLTYLGNVFKNISELQGKLKESTEVGAELIGEPSVAADAEMIALTVRCLLASGLKDFQITVGQVEYFKGICESAGIDEDTERALKVHITGKNSFAMEEILKELSIPEEYKRQIVDITSLFGGTEIFDRASKHTKNSRSLEAIESLKELYKLLCIYGVEKYVCFDLGMLSKYQYYTGIIFRAYTYGIGDAVAKGGRYDALLEKFGKKAAAIGFVISIDQLMVALKEQHIMVQSDKKNAILVYEPKSIGKAIDFAMSVRNEGGSIELIPSNGTDNFDEYISFNRDGLVDEIYYAADNKVIKKK